MTPAYKKRKRDLWDDKGDDMPQEMQLQSDGKDALSGSEDSDEVQKFPELDTRSDSENDEEENHDDNDDEDESILEEDQGTSDDYTTPSEDDDNTLSVFPKPKTVISQITGRLKRVYPPIEPEYDSDSSTEDAPNRVGNIPMHWYDDLPHVGYDINGKKVLRPARGDELDRFLETVDDPSSWTTAFDHNIQAEKSLTAEELDIIRRLQENEIPDAKFDPYEVFLKDVKPEIMPLSGAPEPKRRWVPSKWEKQKVMKIVRAIRQGRILPGKPKTASGPRQFYSLWSTPSESSSVSAPLPAPKRPSPTNAESYNPPPEYLPDRSSPPPEKDEDDKSYTPKSYSALRLVPGYDRFINERFDRLLDLYMAPRVQRRRLPPGVTKADDLIPQLPDPKTLRPFPTYRALCHRHQTHVRAIGVSPGGEWVVSADETGQVRLWETLVGREVKTWRVEGKVGAVDWCPRRDVSFFIVGTEETLHAFIPPFLPPDVESVTFSLLAPEKLPPTSPVPSPIKWMSPAAATNTDGPALAIQLSPSSGLPKQITWHCRGDYFASVSGKEGQGSVWIHQLSRRHSQAPFRKIKGAVQRVLFHPLKPHLFVATQRYVRLYDLSAQQLLKTLMPGFKWISSMDVHPSGDHLIVGGYDRKLCWFDLELSEKPYKILRYHSRALRSLAFHPTYPLFASTSDDGTVQVFHARIYNDLLTDPLIVPLKILRGHSISDGLGVLEARWCPRMPWLVTAGADGAVNLWCS